MPINSRMEAVSASGIFRRAFGRRRCLVTADLHLQKLTVDSILVTWLA